MTCNTLRMSTSHYIKDLSSVSKEDNEEHRFFKKHPRQSPLCIGSGKNNEHKFLVRSQKVSLSAWAVKISAFDLSSVSQSKPMYQSFSQKSRASSLTAEAVKEYSCSARNFVKCSARSRPGVRQSMTFIDGHCVLCVVIQTTVAQFLDDIRNSLPPSGCREREPSLSEDLQVTFVDGCCTRHTVRFRHIVRRASRSRTALPPSGEAQPCSLSRTGSSSMILGMGMILRRFHGTASRGRGRGTIVRLTSSTFSSKGRRDQTAVSAASQSDEKKLLDLCSDFHCVLGRLFGNELFLHSCGRVWRVHQTGGVHGVCWR